MDALDVPQSFDALHFAAIGVVAFLAAVVGGLSGFGGGLLVTPFLVPLVGIKAVVPVMAVAMVIGNASRLWVYRKDLRIGIALKIVVAAVPGVVVGTLIYDLLPRDWLAAVIGAFLIVSVPLRRKIDDRAATPTLPVIVVVSSLFGVVSGTLPGGGVVLLSLLLGFGLSAGGLVGTDAFVGIAVTLVKIAMFGSLDLIDRDIFLAGLFIGLCMIPGAYGARWLIRRLSVTIHTVLVEAIVIASGAFFVWTAFATG